MTNREQAEQITAKWFDGSFLNDDSLIDAVETALDEAVAQARREVWEEAREWIRNEWLAAYPVEVFPEPPPPPAECSRDVISAAMGRHIATRLIEEFIALEARKESEG